MTIERYDRQQRVLGPQAQERIGRASVLVAGCGALGCAQAQLLARAGVGRLHVVDRDFVELSNLQRQILFDESDAAEVLPKAEAAARKLRAVNSEITITPHVVDLTCGNIERLLEGIDLVVDGTDNLETRYLLNDACVKRSIPWIYGGAVGTEGVVMPVVPGVGPCLRCLFEEPAPPGTLPTCDVQGVLSVAPVAVAALQVTEALRLLTEPGPPPARLVALDLWQGSFRTVHVGRRQACPCCGQQRFDFLTGRAAFRATSLCGREAVQVRPSREVQVDLNLLAERLRGVGTVSSNGLILKLDVERYSLHVFPDGRAIVKGTDDGAVARALYARYVGS